MLQFPRPGACLDNGWNIIHRIRKIGVAILELLGAGGNCLLVTGTCHISSNLLFNYDNLSIYDRK